VQKAQWGGKVNTETERKRKWDAPHRTWPQTKQIGIAASGENKSRGPRTNTEKRPTTNGTYNPSHLLGRPLREKIMFLQGRGKTKKAEGWGKKGGTSTNSSDQKETSLGGEDRPKHLEPIGLTYLGGRSRKEKTSTGETSSRFHEAGRIRQTSIKVRLQLEKPAQQGQTSKKNFESH